MSFTATKWVMRDVRGLAQSERNVLFVLAEMSNESDPLKHAWPSVATLSECCEMSPRTVHRALQALEGKGFIRRGDQSLASGIRGDRRPVVWSLNVGLKPSTG